MQDEQRRKSVVLEYFRRLNAGDVSGVLELLAEDARIEDPVGGDPQHGRVAQRAYVLGQIGEKSRFSPGYIVASHDQEQAAVPYTMQAAGGVTNALGIFRVGPQGLIKEFRAFWGLTDKE